MWEPRRLTTLWAVTACYRDSFTFTLPITWEINGRVRILDNILIALSWLTQGLAGSVPIKTFRTTNCPKLSLS
jgi:hypothetical protein